MRTFFLISCGLGFMAGTYFRPRPQPLSGSRGITSATPVQATNAANLAGTAISVTEKMDANLAVHPVAEVALTSPDVAEISLSVRAALACQGFTDDQFPELIENVISRDWSFLEKITALRMIVSQWGKNDPKVALAAIKNLPKDFQSITMETLWGIWARVDLAGLREHAQELHEAAQAQGKTFIPSEALTKADPIGSLNRCLANDQHDFHRAGEVSFPGKPTDISFKSADPQTPASAWTHISPDAGSALRSWLKRDPAAATAWTREAMSSQPLHPGLEYFLIDLLSQEGTHAEAASLATEHLSAPLADSLLSRILPRWTAQDVAAAGAWMQAHGR